MEIKHVQFSHEARGQLSRVLTARNEWFFVFVLPVFLMILKRSDFDVMLGTSLMIQYEGHKPEVITSVLMSWFAPVYLRRKKRILCVVGNLEVPSHELVVQVVAVVSKERVKL